MKITKQILSLILALVLVLGLLPATAFATDAADVVYLSISFDSNYIDDKNGDPIAYVPVSLADIEAIDLTAYGLDNMLYDADGDGDYEATALQLLLQLGQGMLYICPLALTVITLTTKTAIPLLMFLYLCPQSKPST